jgi:hypothetical protein
VGAQLVLGEDGLDVAAVDDLDVDVGGQTGRDRPAAAEVPGPVAVE